MLRCVGEVVLAANDVGDPHIGIVDHNGEVIERRAVGAQDHQVATQGVAVNLDPPADKVINNNNARLNAEAQRRRLTGCDAGGRGFGGNRGAAAGVARWKFGRFTSLALCIEIAWGTEAGVGQPFGAELICHRGVALTSFRLSVWAAIAALPLCNDTLIGAKAEPGEPCKNVGLKLLGGACGVGVFNAHDVRAAMTAREQQVEERRSRRTDVERAGWAWRDTNAHDIAHERAGI